MLKDSRRIRRRAGKVREMDVLTSFAAKVHPEEEQDCRVQLLEHLGAERRKQARKLHAKITKYGAAVRGRLKKTNEDLEEALSANGNDEAERIRSKYLRVSPGSDETPPATTFRNGVESDAGNCSLRPGGYRAHGRRGRSEAE